LSLTVPGRGRVKTLISDRIGQLGEGWLWGDSLRAKTGGSHSCCRLLDDYVTEDNPVRVVEAFIDELELGALGFEGVQPASTGRPGYHPSTLLKIYLYGYLNRVQSSRRLEREAQRNVELMWLTGRLAPDFKTIANFRRDNGAAIRAACAQFIVLCRQLGLFTRSVVAIDGSKFKAVNNRDKNFTMAKVAKRMEQVDASIVRYLAALDRADRDESDVAEARTTRIKDKIARLRQQMQALQAMKEKVQDAPDQQISLTDPDVALWRRADAGQASSATMFKPRSMPNII
jgi:transposase